MTPRSSGVFKGALAESAARAAKRALSQARVRNWKPLPDDLEGALRIFLYHRITDDSDPLALTPAKFRTQMEYLATIGIRALDAVSALDLLYARELEPRTVAVTFDDGFQDVLDNAHPVLAELGFSATVFVSTAVIDGAADYSWAPPGAVTPSWAQIRRMEASGALRFEPHSRTHPDLRRLDDVEARAEIAGSKAELEQQIERETHAFCYPGGFVESRERELVREAGLRYGVTCEPGMNTASTDPYLIHRVQVESTDSLRTFRAKVAGSHDRPLLGRRRYRRVRYGVTSVLESSVPEMTADAGSTLQTARVAVVIPCFNDGAFVCDALGSIRECEPVEIVIIDDGSSDTATLETLSRLAAQGVDVRHQPNRGLSAARMAGVAATSAPYVFPLDADDQLSPGCLASLADVLDADDSLSFVYGHLEFTGARVGGRKAQDWNPFTLLYANRWGANCLYRRDALLAVGGWSFDDIYEDWDLLLALAEHGYSGAPVDRLVLHYRIHASARMNTRGHERYATLYRQLMARHPQLFARRSELAAQYAVPRWRRFVYPLLFGTRPLYPFTVHRAVVVLRDQFARRTRRLSSRG